MKRLQATALLVLISILAIAGAYLFLLGSVPESPENAFELFLTREVAEDQIMDPLILAGDEVVPLLVDAIANEDLPRRRYAIGALANLGATAAIPNLRAIVLDVSEPDYLRCDALGAVALISRDSGRDLANELETTASDCLNETKSAIIGKDFASWKERHYFRRTYVEALLGRHS